MNRYCFALDLKDDPMLIQEYDEYHKAVWPEVERSISGAGIKHMEIYRVGNRLFMIMEVDESFTLEKKAIADAANSTVKEWETLMWQYQQALPFAEKGEKWKQMTRIYLFETEAGRQRP